MKLLLIFWGAICFAVTILTLWECFKFTIDNLTGSDMQKDTFITKINSVSLNDNKVNKAVPLKINSLIVNGEDWIK